MEKLEDKTSKPSKKSEQKNFSSIAAYVYVSESELVKAFEDYDSQWEHTQPDAFKSLLYSLGMNTDQPYKRYDGLQHRNRFNEVVACSRWVGSERHDQAWVKSGYASKEALDRNKNSRLLDNLYEQRGLTEGIQKMLEQRDSYSKEED